MWGLEGAPLGAFLILLIEKLAANKKCGYKMQSMDYDVRQSMHNLSGETVRLLACETAGQ